MTAALTVRPATRPEHTGSDHICLPLTDVLARIDHATSHGHATITFPGPSGGWHLSLDGADTRGYLRLLADARIRHYDTVRVSTGPDGMTTVGVVRRRHRRTARR